MLFISFRFSLFLKKQGPLKTEFLDALFNLISKNTSLAVLVMVIAWFRVQLTANLTSDKGRHNLAP